MMRLNKKQVLKIHELLCEKTGGAFGVREDSLLSSAIYSAFQTFGGEELYKTTEEKAARMGFSLISNHAFIDGNKRIGLLVALVFLRANGINLKFTNEELISLGLTLAKGEGGYELLLSFIKEHKIK